jgi:hypothetical protein
MAADRTRGSASSPTRNRRLRLIRTIATTPSSTPTPIDATASGVAEPVSWCRPSPAAAMTRPVRAAESSANTARRVGSEVASTCSITSRWNVAASPLACRTDCRNEVPSSRKDAASTMYPMTKCSAGSGWNSSWTPCVTETAPPATNSPSAANSAHTYASRPWPDGWARSGGRLDRRSAISRKISLPVSAHECAASATSDADPVSTAAPDFATAITRLAVKATRTVTRLSDVTDPRSCGISASGSRGSVTGATRGRGGAGLGRGRGSLVRP